MAVSYIRAFTKFTTDKFKNCNHFFMFERKEEKKTSQTIQQKNDFHSNILRIKVRAVFFLSRRVYLFYGKNAKNETLIENFVKSHLFAFDDYLFRIHVFKQFNYGIAHTQKQVIGVVMKNANVAYKKPPLSFIK